HYAIIDTGEELFLRTCDNRGIGGIGVLVNMSFNSFKAKSIDSFKREVIKENLKERRASVLADAAEAGKSICNACLSFANYKMKMTALRRLDGSVTSSRRAMERVIHDFYLDLFNSHVHLPTYQIPQAGYVVPNVLPSEIRQVILSVKTCIAPGPEKVRPEHLKNLLLVLINTVARLFTRYLSECKVPSQEKASRTILLYKQRNIHDIGNYRQICLLSI
ncbi:uncharacterized protein LOC129405016, partial [Sorex araneus]|uniref:uncharacterized protein LOC129405016 n=1 Tax=Sorex araneus TaxID=42254 RepID=UPI002433C8D7